MHQHFNSSLVKDLFVNSARTAPNSNKLALNKTARFALPSHIYKKKIQKSDSTTTATFQLQLVVLTAMALDTSEESQSSKSFLSAINSEKLFSKAFKEKSLNLSQKHQTSPPFIKTEYLKSLKGKLHLKKFIE